jgi:hypothetical protein
MKDIEGIEQAVRALEPHWKDIEAEFNRHNTRFLKLAFTDHDAIGRVLRSHLVIENFLDTYLTDRFKIEDFSSLRLTFAQKAKLLPHKNEAVSWVRPGIIQLNAVRNRLGHSLDYTPEPHDISAIYECLRIARKGTAFESPVAAIEAFAAIACAFLSIPPKHLQQVFWKAFRGVKSSVYEPPDTA